MSAAVQAKVDTSSLEKLQQVVGDYVELTGKDASVALQKAAREVDFAMFDQLRNQPPRPVRGSISAAARARGFTLNVNSDSYITGYQQAVAMLGGYKSGYFRISEKDGVVSVAPVFLGAAGRIFKGKPNKRSTDHVLVTPETELDAKARAGIPADAKELNLGALAVILGLKQREKAGSGGYMAAEFLTYKALNRTNLVSATYRTKDSKTVGAVDSNRSGGSLSRVVITGYVPHADSIATKNGIFNKAVSAGADSYRADMYRYIVERAEKTLAKLN